MRQARRKVGASQATRTGEAGAMGAEGLGRGGCGRETTVEAQRCCFSHNVCDDTWWRQIQVQLGQLVSPKLKAQRVSL